VEDGMRLLALNAASERSQKRRGDQMTHAATKQVGQLIDGRFRLGQFVGGDERGSVFLVDYDRQQVPKAAIKLIPADSVDAPGQLARWRQAAKLSHPHLIRLLEMGRCELDQTPMLYVVMEYAEENLSQVVARRPLSPAEARDILGPVVDALAYVHAKGFVHCRLKPANVMADNDLLKISSDGLCRIGDSSGAAGKPGAYDPPEAAGGRISPAGDVWSLGMTLAEALTQRLPVWERTNQAEPALPSNLPPEILDLARHCLRRDPQLRWTVADISARLQQNSPAPPRQIAPTSQTSFANPRAIGGVVLAVVALAAILGGLLLLKTHSQPQPSAPVATNAVPQQHTAPPQQPPLVAKTTPQPAPTSAKRSPKNPSETKPAASTPAPLPSPVRSASPAATSASGFVHAKVLQQILPDAPQKARDTIRGKVRISIKVHVNESGAVTEASFAAPGPSSYFADRTLKAAQLWKFTPAKLDGRNVPSDWLLHFEIDPASTTVNPTETAP
jgi:TonB family protein